MAGYRFRVYAKDGDDLGLREFAMADWKPGDTIALRDRVDRVHDVVYLDDDSDVRGMLMLEEPSRSASCCTGSATSPRRAPFMP